MVVTATVESVQTPTAFGYRPELDGLRAFAVLAVVAFHADLTVFANGYLGVDVFFVLSGFLVTNVLVTELENHGRIRLTRFYARRIRRLLPAASATIVLTLIGMRIVTNASERAGLGADARSAALWFANVNVIDRLADGVDRPSPLFHFWSLSIEEQFYVLFPLLIMGLVVFARARPQQLWVPLVVATVATMMVQVIANQADWGLAYYSTPARSYQLLAGASVAAFMRFHSSRLPTVPSATAPVCFGLVALLTLSFAPGVDLSGRGMLTTVLMVLGLGAADMRPRTTRRFLGSKPQVYLGGLSYAIYLVHVPIGVLTDYTFDPIAPWPKFAYTAVASIGVAAISSIVLEHPIRTSERLDEQHRLVIAMGLVSALVVAFLITPLLA